jgi:alginate O-acetyltransferase complex protein AlgI
VSPVPDGTTQERRRTGSNSQEDDKPWTIIGVIRAFLVFNVVSVLWLLFKLPDFRQVIEYVRCLAHNPFGIKPQTLFVIGLFSLPIILMHLHAASGQWRARMRERVGPRAWAWSEAIGYAAMILLIVVNSGTPGEFIYFQF